MSDPGSVLHGTMFQARIFLREALKLLDPASGVVQGKNPASRGLMTFGSKFAKRWGGAG